MSRIDEALKRLSGVVTSDPRPGTTLDGYAPEGEPSDEPTRAARPEEHRVANFVAARPRPIETRHAARQTVPVPDATPQTETTGDADPIDQPEPLVNIKELFDYGGFVARSVMRH